MKKILLTVISLVFISSIAFADTVRVFYKQDKSVVILIPPNNISSEDYEPAMQRSMKKSNLEELPYDDIDRVLLPQSRENRNAWEGEKGKEVKVNPAKIKPKEKTLLERVEALEKK